MYMYIGVFVAITCSCDIDHMSTDLLFIFAHFLQCIQCFLVDIGCWLCVFVNFPLVGCCFGVIFTIVVSSTSQSILSVLSWWILVVGFVYW